MVEIILEDRAGKLRDFNLTDHYRKLIAGWKKEQEDELLRTARKDYPKLENLRELVQRTKGREIRQIPYLVLHEIAVLCRYLLFETQKKFKPNTFEGYMEPEILAYDAALRLKQGQDWQDIKLLHRRSVEAALTGTFHRDVLKSKSMKEQYGWKIIEVIFRDDQKALNGIENMLKKNREGRLDEIAKLLPFEERSDMTAGLVHKTVAKKIEKSRKNVPKLTAFLPDELDPLVRTEMKGLLASYEPNSKDAKVFSDAVVGLFQTLPHEFWADLQDEVEKITAQKRSSEEKISRDQDDGMELTFSEVGQRIFEIQENIINKLRVPRLLEKLEDELKKPGKEKIKAFYEELRKNPEATDTDLTKFLKIHRNTVSKRRKKLQLLLKKIDK